MTRYVPRTATDVWDELKAKVPKLKTGSFRGSELIEFETTEDLTETELGVIEKVTGKKFKKVE